MFLVTVPYINFELILRIYHIITKNCSSCVIVISLFSEQYQCNINSKL